MLKGKTVIVGITGSIAAYKTPNLVRMLTKLNCNVHVIMTQNATNFIHPISLETISKNKVLIDTFDRSFQYNVEHVALAKQADLVVIAPASANVIGKIANGIADDMLTTTIMACPCKKLISPAMNHNMYHNPIVQDNLRKLKRFGYGIIFPVNGMLANGDTGDGKMPDESEILEHILREIALEKDLKGKKVLITSGATREKLDPVRFITNFSTGRMGNALAKNAMLRGAEVTLVSGWTEVAPPPFVDVIKITSAEEMFNAVSKNFKQNDIIIKAAAVSDYRPETFNEQKIKKNDEFLYMRFEKTQDILKWLGENRCKEQFICGFAMETQDVLQNARTKLINKKIDMIVANSISEEGSGFAHNTNIATIITKDNEYRLEKMAKDELAHIIFNKIIERIS